MKRKLLLIVYFLFNFCPNIFATNNIVSEEELVSKATFVGIFKAIIAIVVIFIISCIIKDWKDGYFKPKNSEDNTVKKENDVELDKLINKLENK